MFLAAFGCDEVDPEAGDPEGSEPSMCAGGKCDGPWEYAGHRACYSRQDTRYSNMTRCVRTLGEFDSGAPVRLQILERYNPNRQSYDCVEAFEDPWLRENDWDMAVDAELRHVSHVHRGERRDAWLFGPQDETALSYVVDAVDDEIDWAVVQPKRYVKDGRTREGIAIVHDNGRFNSGYAHAFTPIWWPLLNELSDPASSFCTQYRPWVPDPHPFGELHCLDLSFEGSPGEGLGACARTVTGYDDGQKVSNCYKYCLDEQGRPGEGMARLNRARGMPENTTNIECLAEPLTWCLDVLGGGEACLRSTNYDGVELWPFCLAK